MEPNDKKQLVGWVVFVVIVLVAGYFILKGKNNPFTFRSSPNVSGGAATRTSQGTIPAPGASTITKSGEVLAPSGKPADTSAIPGSENAPAQSAPIAKEDVPSSAIKLEVTKEGGFKPTTFTVKSGEAVVLSLTSADNFTHVLRFDDPSLNAVAIGVSPGMTRLIPFNAPKTPGEYKFRDDVPGMTGAGAMFVK